MDGNIWVAAVDERWGYDRIVGLARNRALCARGLESLRDMGQIEREITMEAIACHVTCTLLKGNEWLGVLAGLYRDPSFRQYEDVLDLFSTTSLAVVRREASYVASVKAVLCEEEKSRLIAARERRAADDRKERMMLMAVFGGSVSVGYAGYGAAIGSVGGPVGVLVGAGIGGAIGATVGIIFGANKS